MKKILFALLLLTSNATVLGADNGVISTASRFSTGDTVARLEAALKAKGMTVFAKIDHAQQARKAGLTMRPAQLLVFGNPVSGTPIMQAAPQAGIDLPLKALVWEDAAGKVWVSYNDPAWLQERFGLSDELVKPLAGVRTLMESASR
ncbi:DUF302 domain-containing protein [Massilia sp. H6]|uniref:DUF302 domain-containing protein n=1 Tax=Massilia sp. H6 TaxID=2970464 RepID=UPI002168C795|nr:DUF302 domain-containing protein [Massilia sp. H6]UVW30050.1 DUF302 domain-containing protein [Massilia sp. H6]